MPSVACNLLIANVPDSDGYTLYIQGVLPVISFLRRILHRFLTMVLFWCSAWVSCHFYSWLDSRIENKFDSKINIELRSYARR